MKSKTLCTQLLFITFSLCSIAIKAQGDRLFTADNELSSSMINHIYQDKEGLIWIATEDGLNRYDGAKFMVYREMVKDAPSSNFVTYTFEDSHKRLFIGTLDGVLLHDKATGSFQKIPFSLHTNPHMNAHVTCIMERRDGDILVGTTNHGAFQLKAEGDSLYLKQDISLAPSLSINTLYEDRDKRLWVATTDKGIYLLDGENPYESIFSPSSVQFTSNMAEDIYGNLYIGDNRGNVYQYHRRRDDFFVVPAIDRQASAIKAIYAINQEEMLIATDGDGLRRIHVNRGVVEKSNLSVSSINIDKAKVHTLLKDRQGNTWLGCFQKGVVIRPSTTNNFTYIGRNSATHNCIGDCCVVSLMRDHNGGLWVGTDNDGIYLLTPEGQLKRHFEPGEGAHHVPATITALCEDSRKQIWIGSYQKGLALMNPTDGHCRFMDLKDEMGKQVDKIYDIVEDNNQTLWIATMGNGIYSIDLRTNIATKLKAADSGTRPKENDDMLHNAYVNALKFSPKDNRLYIGTFDGLGCLDLSTYSFKNTWKDNRMMAGRIIYALCEDEQNNLWMATNKGIVILNTETNETKELTTKDGLPSNSIAAIECDAEGSIWISSNYGISRYRPQNGTLVNYYAADGLQGNEFSKRVSFKGEKGEMNFGGTNGVTVFDPRSIVNPSKKPQIYIADFYLKGHPIYQGTLSGRRPITDRPVSETTDFYFSHQDNTIDIEFSAQEFHSPERISYHYNVNNTGWHALPPKSNKLSFSKLAPGTYQLQLYSREYDQKSDIKQIRIHIATPWWRSQTLQYACIMLIIGAILMMAAYAKRRQEWMKQVMIQKHKEELNETKLQFFINVCHEIRTPMSLITGPLQKLMKTDRNAERQHTYSTMQRNAARILQLINQLMDVRKIEKGQMKLKYRETNIEELTRELIENFEYQAKEKNINIGLHAADAGIKAWIDPKNFDKVVVNLISNALKSAPEGGEINIHLKQGKDTKAKTPELRDYVEMGFENNGPAIAPEEAEHIFERFYQLSANSPIENGTGIGLHLTRSIVDLHHGKIWVENNSNKAGCTFFVRIPAGCLHLTAAEMEDANTPAPIVPTTTGQTIFAVHSATAEEVKETAGKKHKVMIVEDDEEIRQYICREFAANFHMQSCTNGKDALQKILQQLPDLVICDIMMPEMDGFTLCKKIKQNVNINHIPVVMLSAKNTDEDTIEALTNGADAYITKPFSMEVLLQTARNLIKGRELLKNNYSGNQAQETRSKAITAASPDERLLDKVMRIINNNIGNANLNVEGIAAEVGISRVHLHRKLKELTNQSTRDLIRNMRLQAAAKLLAEKRHSVAEVAGLTGFSNVTYFTSAFKELYGVPPTAYMEQHASAADEA